MLKELTNNLQNILRFYKNHGKGLFLKLWVYHLMAIPLMFAWFIYPALRYYRKELDIKILWKLVSSNRMTEKWLPFTEQSASNVEGSSLPIIFILLYAGWALFYKSERRMLQDVSYYGLKVLALAAALGALDYFVWNEFLVSSLTFVIWRSSALDLSAHFRFVFPLLAYVCYFSWWESKATFYLKGTGTVETQEKFKLTFKNTATLYLTSLVVVLISERLIGLWSVYPMLFTYNDDFSQAAIISMYMVWTPIAMSIAAVLYLGIFHIYSPNPFKLKPVNS